MEITNNQEVDDNQLHNQFTSRHPRANEFHSYLSHVGVNEG